MKSFEDQKTSVMSFMEAVEEERLREKEEDAFVNSTDYKLKVLDKCEDEAKDKCLNHIFCKIYKDALPLNDCYKQANTKDIDTVFDEFIKTRCPEGIEYYVKEAIRKNSPFAKKVLEAVEELVKNEYQDKALNIEDYATKDLVFNTSDDIIKRLDVIGQNLQGPEISQAIHDNVKSTALSEITRAKNEKEALNNLEKELANDININTPAAVESALELRGLNEIKDFNPSLFQGIMIGKLHQTEMKMESGEVSDVFLYDTLTEFGRPTNENALATIEEIAFVESVKEYTVHSVMKALRMDKYFKRDVDALALKYAEM